MLGSQPVSQKLTKKVFISKCEAEAYTKGIEC